jgi:hypothetical protein
MTAPNAPSDPTELPFDFRRSIDLRLDADGRWYHDGEAFTHAGLIALFNRGIDVSPETGEPIVRVGEQWAYFRCDDVPFIVRTVRLTPDGLEAVLNTEARTTIAPAALRASRSGVLYAAFAPGRLARFSRAAQAALADALTETPEGEVALRWAGGCAAIPTVER